MSVHWLQGLQPVEPGPKVYLVGYKRCLEGYVIADSVDSASAKSDRPVLAELSGALLERMFIILKLEGGLFCLNCGAKVVRPTGHGPTLGDAILCEECFASPTIKEDPRFTGKFIKIGRKI